MDQGHDLEAVLAQFRRDFPPDVVQWKPGATTRDRTRAVGMPYVDSREYIKRLNGVVGAGWQDSYRFLEPAGRLVAICRLTVAGVTRTGDGECQLSDQNAATSASAQAFKRACVKFGLGLYLYDVPKVWADYDERRRRFTDQALADLETYLRDGTLPPRRTGRGNGDGSNGNGDARQVVVKFGKYEGHTLGEIARVEPSYVEWLVENWKWEDGRRAAAALLERIRGAADAPF